MSNYEKLCLEIDRKVAPYRRRLRAALGLERTTIIEEAHRELDHLAAKALAMYYGGKIEDYL